MKFNIFLSTDGKHTVQVEAEEPELADAHKLAEDVYDEIIKKYGTKQEQAVKAYAKKEGFPNDNGPMAKKEEPGIPVCRVHNKPMRQGKYGNWYCATKLSDDSWCKEKGPKI